MRAVLQCLGEDLSEEESKELYIILCNIKKIKNVPILGNTVVGTYYNRYFIYYAISRTIFSLALFILVEDMIKEVDVDGDGRIDFYGKYISTEDVEFIYYYIIVYEYV